MELLEMIKKQVKLLFRNRLAVIATISLPLILAYLFSFSQNNSTQQTLYISNSDKSIYSTQLISMLKKQDIKVINSNEDTLKKKIDNKDISIALILNKNFGDELINNNKMNAKILENHNYSNDLILKETIFSDISSIKNKVQASPNILIKDSSLDKISKIQDSSFGQLLGFLVLFIGFVVVQGCRTLIEEKQNGTFNRLLSSPISYNKFFAAKIISIYIFGALHILSILLGAKYLLNINIYNNLFSIATILALYLLALTSIFLVFIPYMKNQQQFTSLSSTIIMITGMLGGTFFSLESAPKMLQTLSKFTPQGWAMNALTDVMVNNSAIKNEFLPLTIFLVIGIIGLFLSFASLNMSIKKQRY